VTGGALAVEGGIILSLLKMNRILEIDEKNLIAVVEPGVINQDLQKAAEQKGLFYPPDPASLDTSSIGGNVAENAGGPRCLKYGTTREYVLGLEFVLPDGRVITTGVKTRKGVVGYDLTRLIVGSEGTLGVATKIFLKLIPKPQAFLTLLAFFPSISDATDIVARILQKGILPCALEFVDKRCLEIVRKYTSLQLPSGTESFLIIEVDGDREAIHREAEAIGDICLEASGLDVVVAEGTRKREAVWDARRKVSTTVEEKAPLYASEDVVVPIASITAFVNQCPGIEEKFGINIYNFGHAGDGNIHVNMTADENTEETRKRMEGAVGEVFRAALALGGTISGEHGVGIVKQPFLSLELSETSIEIQRQIKTVFDPLNIMNPGKIFPKVPS
jgi:glycolate oxidase subunit GlcD